MTIENGNNPPPRRKPLWPWLLLLVLTLCAIYSYNRASEFMDEFMRDMPDEIIRLFNDLLQSDRGRRGGLEVSVPFVDVSVR